MKLDEFTQAYVECALWSSTDDDCNPLDDSYTVDNIHPDTLASMVEDCKRFQVDHYDDITADVSRAGHDFWLTRNGHGAGFWDGDWPDVIGRRLTAASCTFGECNLYAGNDNCIHRL